MKRLQDLLEGSFLVKGYAGEDVYVKGICSDSREVKEGFVFFALPGSRAHGIMFADEAVKRGAVAVVSDVDWHGSFPAFVKVKDVRHVYGLAASRFYDNPSQSLRLIFVTGTNGKTTVSYVLAQVLNILGEKARYIGTLGVSQSKVKLNLTTPDAAHFQRLLKMSVDEGFDFVIAESSSHALDQERLCGSHPDACIFTNLSRDHLDYHKDMHSYFEAKLKLFTHLLAGSKKREKYAVINADNKWGERAMSEIKRCMRGVHVLTYGLTPGAGVRGHILSESLDGVEFKVDVGGKILNVRSRLTGTHNVYNLLGVIATGYIFGFDLAHMAEGIQLVTPPPGRLEPVGSLKDRYIFVDYAHTPDALEKVLKTLRPLTERRLIVVFGCGGDRDRGKRPQMGRVAEKYADVVILTSDNPRTEDPDKIIDEILAGIQSNDKVVVQPDRKKAIEMAVKMMKKGDVLVIAGKGHEDYQIIGREKIHFSDREEVLKVLGEA